MNDQEAANTERTKAEARLLNAQVEAIELDNAKKKADK